MMLKCITRLGIFLLEHNYVIVGDTVWISCKKGDVLSSIFGSRIIDVSADDVIDPEKEYKYNDIASMS